MFKIKFDGHLVHFSELVEQSIQLGAEHSTHILLKFLPYKLGQFEAQTLIGLLPINSGSATI